MRACVQGMNEGAQGVWPLYRAAVGESARTARLYRKVARMRRLSVGI